MLDLNPALNVRKIAARFAADRRIQIRDFLTPSSASALLKLLQEDTPWGLAWQSQQTRPTMLTRAQLDALSHDERAAIDAELSASMARGGHAFSYSVYPLVTAYLEQWRPGGAHDLLLESLNQPALLDFVRAVSGITDLVKADGQATLYAPGQFLASHDDYDPHLGRRVAYVLSLCAIDWRPDWGGYLTFHDIDGDTITAFRPRFNALNLFEVPQQHSVTLVPPYAPNGRYAVTGWFFDRI